MMIFIPNQKMGETLYHQPDSKNGGWLDKLRISFQGDLEVQDT